MFWTSVFVSFWAMTISFAVFAVNMNGFDWEHVTSISQLWWFLPLPLVMLLGIAAIYTFRNVIRERAREYNWKTTKPQVYRTSYWLAMLYFLIIQIVLAGLGGGIKLFSIGRISYLIVLLFLFNPIQQLLYGFRQLYENPGKRLNVFVLIPLTIVMWPTGLEVFIVELDGKDCLVIGSVKPHVNLRLVQVAPRVFMNFVD